MSFLPHFYVVINAIFWGLVWIPLGWFDQNGLHPVSITFFSYFLLLIFLLPFNFSLVKIFLFSPALLMMGISYGLTNIFFNWAIVYGDVIRVVFLFYLMPIWASIFARIFLKELIGFYGYVTLFFALFGLTLILDLTNLIKSLNNLDFSSDKIFSDLIALLGGFFFALGNVLLKKNKLQDSMSRSFSIFFGSCIVSLFFLFFGLFFDFFELKSQDFFLLSFELKTFIYLFLFSIVLGLANFFLQYGGSKLLVQTTSLLMLTEIIVVVISTSYFGKNNLLFFDYLGGTIIVTAALYNSLKRDKLN